MSKSKRPLGYVQKHVLLTLSTRGESARNDWAAWYPLRTDQVYGAMESLGRRGFVDVAGFESGPYGSGRDVRTFAITAKGEAFLEELHADPDEELEKLESE